MVLEHHLPGGGLEATHQRQLHQDCFTGHTHSTSRQICCYTRFARKRQTRFTAGHTLSGALTVCRFGNQLDQVCTTQMARPRIKFVAAGECMGCWTLPVFNLVDMQGHWQAERNVPDVRLSSQINLTSYASIPETEASQQLAPQTEKVSPRLIPGMFDTACCLYTLACIQ